MRKEKARTLEDTGNVTWRANSCRKDPSTSITEYHQNPRIKIDRITDAARATESKLNASIQISGIKPSFPHNMGFRFLCLGVTPNE